MCWQEELKKCLEVSKMIKFVLAVLVLSIAVSSGENVVEHGHFAESYISDEIYPGPVTQVSVASTVINGDNNIVRISVGQQVHMVPSGRKLVNPMGFSQIAGIFVDIDGMDNIVDASISQIATANMVYDVVRHSEDRASLDIQNINKIV